MPWRWEDQMEQFYGRAKSFFLDDDVGWLQTAQDHVLWKSREKVFSFHTVESHWGYPFTSLTERQLDVSLLNV